MFRRTLLFSLLAGCATTQRPPTAELSSRTPAADSHADAQYVAMGSSFASGPAITEPAQPASGRCARSADNYAHQLARLRGWSLVDVSCAGATTQHILGRWNELPPQIDALTAGTRLVTLTIGGNDVGYNGRMTAGACRGIAADPAHVARPLCESTAKFMASASPQLRELVDAPLTEEHWRRLDSELDEILREVHRRAPQARVVLVDYLTVLPPHALCGQVPLSAQDASALRSIADRLARAVAGAARRGHALLLRASSLSREHHACSPEPWVTGLLRPADSARFAAFHPNLAGMAAIARELDRRLDGSL